MKIRAESALRSAVGMAHVVSAYLAFAAQCANFTHSTPPYTKLDLPEYNTTFGGSTQVKTASFAKILKKFMCRTVKMMKNQQKA